MVSDPDWLNQKIFQILSPSDLAVLEKRFDDDSTKTLTMAASSTEDMNTASSRSRELSQVGQRSASTEITHPAVVLDRKATFGVGMDVDKTTETTKVLENNNPKDQKSELVRVPLSKGDSHVTTEFRTDQVREEPIGGSGSPSNVSPLSTSLENVSELKPKAVLSTSLSSSESSPKDVFLPDIVMVKDSDGPENTEERQRQDEDTQEHLKKPGIGRRASDLLMKKLGLGSKKEEGKAKKEEDERSTSNDTVDQKLTQVTDSVPASTSTSSLSEETPQTTMACPIRFAMCQANRQAFKTNLCPKFLQDSFVSIPEDENELYSPFEQVTMEEVMASIARRSAASDSRVRTESASDKLAALPIHRTKSNSESKVGNEDATVRTVSQPISISAPSTKLPRSATSPGILSSSPNRSPNSHSPNLNRFRLSPSKERERQMRRSVSSSPGSERATFPQGEIRASAENIPEGLARRHDGKDETDRASHHGKDETDRASHHGKESHQSSKLFHNVRIPKTQTAVEYKGMGTRKYTLYRVQVCVWKGRRGSTCKRPVTPNLLL
ncbi:hypothetical protein Bbelb_246640 [Branchiostoma belcheri]|nr:hypothetical protein Bbelb_246640 [Branchiostoma belcheri]